MVFFIILIFIVALIIGIKMNKHKKLVMNAFDDGNVIVFGKKGKGKDLLFQYVINHRKKEEYFSNINYGHNYKPITIKDLELNNTYEDFIADDIKIVDKIDDRENKDIYISDAGIYLPSQYDSKLHKLYPSLSIYYALSRHLYNSNIHCNTQALDRLFKSLREQADSFIKCINCVKIFGLFIVSFTYYDKYSSALADLRPMKKGLFGSKEMKARIEQYNATNGEIINGVVCLTKKNIHYNTRAFHEKLFGKVV